MTAIEKHTEALARSAFFQGLARDTLVAIVTAGKPVELVTGDMVFNAGESYQQSLFLVIAGEVELIRANGDPGIFGVGSILGLSNYIDGEPYHSSVRATCDSIVLQIADDTVRQLEQDHVTFADLLNHIIAERIRARSTTSTISGLMTQPVRDAMKSPLSSCGTDISLRDAHYLMQVRKLGSLGVISEEGKLVGVLTFAGLSEALIDKGASPDDSIMRAACESPQTIDQDAPLWQADERLQDFGTKYLVVTANGKPAGMISQGEILKLQLARQPSMMRIVRGTGNITSLRDRYAAIHEVAREAHNNNRLATTAVRVLSDSHLEIQRRCVELTLEEMVHENLGGAPRDYALLIMGSGGRGEMLLTPDQDNGLIISDEPGSLSPGETMWFEEFASRLNRNLDTAGYIFCPGEIMARNTRFHKTLKAWKLQISQMLLQPTQKSARWSNVVFDFVTLYGDDALTHELRTHLLQGLQSHRTLLGFMVEDDAEGRPPLGLFNRLITATDGGRKGMIDIKRNGLRIIADAARIYSLSAGISSCGTTERLQALVRQGILSADLVDSVSAACEELLDLLLTHQLNQVEAGQPPDKLVRPEELSTRRHSALRIAMRAVKRFQDQLQGEFGRATF
ncbi:MAG: putative nucleotidyltransferase substrate binding domain-containing protein [Acidiferrobacterales bacterium]